MVLWKAQRPLFVTNAVHYLQTWRTATKKTSYLPTRSKLVRAAATSYLLLEKKLCSRNESAVRNERKKGYSYA